jgi:uncharacterized membrane protein
VIRKAILAAAAIYLGITLLQAAARGSLLLQAVVFGAVLAGGTALYFFRDEHKLEKVEISILWICILLFVLYMAPKLAGVA